MTRAVHPGWTNPRRPHASPAVDRPLLGLTERQYQVLRLRTRGMSSERIAQVLGISTGSVNKTLGKAYRRLGIDADYPGPAAGYLLGRYDEKHHGSTPS